MNEVKKATFRFENYSFDSFRYSEPQSSDAEGLFIQITPSGEYNPINNTFKLNLKFKAASNEETLATGHSSIELNMISHFSFDSEEGVPKFFYTNSLGIVFPFLRSFLSAMTLQANIKHMLLPILNLSHLETQLIENTVTISDEDKN